MNIALRTRAAWIHEATIQLGVAALQFLTVRLALKNGRARWARSWQPVINDRLICRLMILLAQPVAQEFDPATAIEFVIGEVEQRMGPIGAEVEVRFGEVCPIRRGLTRRDQALFMAWAREAVVLLLREVHGGPQLPRVH